MGERESWDPDRVLMLMTAISAPQPRNAIPGECHFLQRQLYETLPSGDMIRGLMSPPPSICPRSSASEGIVMK